MLLQTIAFKTILSIIVLHFHQLSVVVTDNGFPRLSNSVRVTIIVVRNRNGPVFTQSLYEIDITENWPANARIDVNLNATDADGDQDELEVKYYL